MGARVEWWLLGLVVRGDSSLELGVFGGLFLGFFGGFGFGGGSFFGGQLGFFFLGLEVTNVVYSLTVEVHAGQAGALTGALAHVGEVVAADFAALGNFDF